jgi:hypothetical protein
MSFWVELNAQKEWYLKNGVLIDEDIKKMAELHPKRHSFHSTLVLYIRLLSTGSIHILTSDLLRHFLWCQVMVIWSAYIRMARFKPRRGQWKRGRRVRHELIKVGKRLNDKGLFDLRIDSLHVPPRIKNVTFFWTLTFSYAKWRTPFKIYMEKGMLHTYPMMLWMLCFLEWITVSGHFKTGAILGLCVVLTDT